MARSTQAGATTSVRVAAPIEPELVYINLLTADERRDALVAAGRAKQRGLDEKLRQAVIGRLRRGEIQPQRIDPQIGQPYPGLDWSVQHPEANGEVVNVGRVPGYPEYQVYRAADGRLWVLSPQELEERREATRAAANSEVRLSGQAVPLDEPVPQVSLAMSLVLAAAVGLLLGIATAFLRELGDTRTQAKTS